MKKFYQLNANSLVAEPSDIFDASHPNINVVGSPTFVMGNVSGFSANNYLVFPTEVNVGKNSVDFHLSFTTGPDVTTQQNILDSHCGIALAIKDGCYIIACSFDGTTFRQGFGLSELEPNTSYRIKIRFWHDVYQQSTDEYHFAIFSADGSGDYVLDSDEIIMLYPLFPTATYWGGANPKSGVNHIFGGSINLNECRIVWNGNTVWQGYGAPDVVRYDPTSEDPLNTAEKIVKVVEDAVSRDNRFLVGGSYSTAPEVGSPTTAAIQTRTDETAEWQTEIRVDKGYDALTGNVMVKLDKSVQTVTVAGSNLVIEIPDSVDGTVRDLCVYANNSSNADTALTFPAGTYYGDDPNGAVAKAGKVTAIYLTEIPKGAWMLRISELDQHEVTA